MNGLKKTIMGYYHTKEVEKLIAKIKSDYEACLKEQKQRILDLRAENKALSTAAEKLSINVQYAAITLRRAEQAAKLIREQAEVEARQIVTDAEKKGLQLRAETEACRRNLLRIKQASETVYLAACKAAGNECITDDTIRAAAHAVLSLK